MKETLLVWIARRIKGVSSYIIWFICGCFSIVLLMSLLSGCNSLSQDDPGSEIILPYEDPIANVDPTTTNDGIIRRAICIGFTNNKEGDAPCPGCDIDAAKVFTWPLGEAIFILMNGNAPKEDIKAKIVELTKDMQPIDRLFVSISGHGTRRPDESGDEEDGFDEGLVLWDCIWWDDEIYEFICGLPPFRLEPLCDTCHAENNWRTLGYYATGTLLFKPQKIQIDLVSEARGRHDSSWEGSIVEYAGCREDKYSYGDAENGGTWTGAMDDALETATSKRDWFEKAKAKMPKNQEPVLCTYNADEWLDKPPLW